MKKEIYLAGGCFWGLEKYMASIHGVLQTKVGYANGTTEQPTYEEVCKGTTGYVETVAICYDDDELPLTYLLSLFFEVIDPTALNRQGPDIGTQYRTGIYYVDAMDKKTIQQALDHLQFQYKHPIVVEIQPLQAFYEAEEYHQNYLDKNAGGYCHISRKKMNDVKNMKWEQYPKKRKEELRNELTDLQYAVTQENATEPPFQNQYNEEFGEGIYVDITTGEPLFRSTDKFESGCGWPSFSAPIDPSLVMEREDMSYGQIRTEVRSSKGDAHLGHVFDEKNGLRYCINSASLQFIPKEEMEKKGYGAYLPLLS